MLLLAGLFLAAAARAEGPRPGIAGEPSTDRASPAEASLTESSPANPTPGAAGAVVQAFYAALARGDCGLAARLRRPYSVARCRAVRELAVTRIEPRYQDDRLGIVFVDVSYRTGAADQSRDETFRGFVQAIRTEDRWLIDGRSYRPWAETGLDRYLREVAGISRGHGADAVSMALPPPATRGDAAARPGPPRAAPTATGSAAILSAVWPASALQAVPGETRARSRKPPDRSPPTRISPDRTSPETASSGRTGTAGPRSPLPAALHGSLRRVRPAEGDRPIALTFDLCEQADEVTGYDGAIVDYLRAERVPATFFAGGKWLRSHTERAMQLIADPLFEVGNHAWTHGNFRVLDPARAETEITWTEAQYAELRDALAGRAREAGIDAAEIATIPQAPRAFRFPYGACNPQALALTARLGLPAIQWDVVSGDAAGGRSARAMAASVLAASTPGSIVVMHANGRGHGTAAALPAIVAGLRGRGFRFVTIGDLLAAGEPVAAADCYELKPGDNRRYDALFGDGTQ
jgi:peptidoglycan/xylan/chitin deacetylase (PgdA/CDA1 family)